MLRAKEAGKEMWRVWHTAAALVLVIIAWVCPTLAQVPSPSEHRAVSPLAPLDTSSPRATMASFITESAAIVSEFQTYRETRSSAAAEALLRRANRARQLFDLRALPPAIQHKTGRESVASLIDILHRLPEIRLEDVPGGDATDPRTLPPRWTIPETEIRIVRIDQGEDAGAYLFSSETVARLPEFLTRIIDDPPRSSLPFHSFKEEALRITGPMIPSGFVDAIPQVLQRPTLGTVLWKVIASVALRLAVLVAVIAWALMLHRLLRGARPAWRLGAQLTTPGLLAGLTLLVHRFIIPEVNISGAYASGEAVFTVVLLYTAMAWAAWIAIYFIVEAIIAAPQIPDASYDANLLRLLARVCAITAAAATLVWGANDIGVPALGLVAGLGVGGIAVALAAQSTIENLIGGITLFADRPFRVGDTIQSGDRIGRVEAIGPRSCRIRSLDGPLITVPNADLAKAQITNLTVRTLCSFRERIGLRFETTTQQLAWFVETLRARLAAHPLVETAPGWPRVSVIGFGASSIDVEVWARVLTNDWDTFLAVRQALALDVIATVEAAGTGFAFPSQTTYLTRDKGIAGALGEEAASQPPPAAR
jgi:MscS family membrane protein